MPFWKKVSLLSQSDVFKLRYRLCFLLWSEFNTVNKQLLIALIIYNFRPRWLWCIKKWNKEVVLTAPEKIWQNWIFIFCKIFIFPNISKASANHIQIYTVIQLENIMCHFFVITNQSQHVHINSTHAVLHNMTCCCSSVRTNFSKSNLADEFT